MSDDRVRLVDEEEELASARVQISSDVELVTPPGLPGWRSFAPQRAAHGIAVAPDGACLWLASWGGVIEWQRQGDGVCRRYGSEHGLGVPATICLDAAGQPWVARADRGLVWYDKDAARWRNYPWLVTEPIRALCLTPDGIAAAGSRSVYLLHSGDREPTLLAADHQGAEEAICLLADGANLLLGNDWGLFRLSPTTTPVALWPEIFTACVALGRTADGVIWAVGPTGIYPISEGAPGEPIRPTGAIDPVLALAVGRRRLWLLCGESLAMIEGGRWYDLGRPDTETSVRAIVHSGDDSYLWAATDRGLMGLYLPDGSTEGQWNANLLPAHDDDSLCGLALCAVPRNADGLWVGTVSGLLVGDEATERLRPATFAGEVRSLCLVGDDTYLITPTDGIGRLDSMIGYADFDAIDQPPGLPLALAAGLDGRLLALTSRGLYRYNNPSWSTLTDQSPRHRPRCLTVAPDGICWLGTVQGAFRLEAGGWAVAGERSGPQGTAILALTVVGDTLFVGTAEGLWAWRRETWRLHGGPRSVIRGVHSLAPARKAKALWVAGAEGVVRYDPATEHICQPEGLGGLPFNPRTSGVPTLPITAMVETASALWLLTRLGVARLKPVSL